MTPTKTQQDTLYVAEEQVTDRGMTFTSIDDIQSYVDGMRDQRWWFTMGYWTVERIEVGRPSKRNEKNGSVGWYEPDMNAGRIEMAEVHWCELFVLHEVAHVLAEAKHGSSSHDPYFARIYLQLVWAALGSDAYVQLRMRFLQHDVNFDAPTLTPSRFAL